MGFWDALGRGGRSGLPGPANEAGPTLWLGLTRSVYGHLPAGASLWSGPGLVAPADTAVLTEVLDRCL